MKTSMSDRHERPPVYLLAVLGRSPAVLTELLWWLVVRDGRRVVGIEVWTTGEGPGTGLDALSRRWGSGLWERLLCAPGVEPSALPPVSKPLPITTHLPTEMLLSNELHVALFESDGRPMADIRSASDALRVADALHARVRKLVHLLPADTALVGSLAGGRKTMSSALQTAFSLQSRPGDRLLHVLTHPQIESDRSVLASFVAPEQELVESLGVPLEAQVEVYEVQVPKLRALVRDDALLRELDEQAFSEVWGQLARRHAPSARMVGLGDGRWQLIASDPTLSQPLSVPLSALQALTWWAIGQHPAGCTDDQWMAWIRDNHSVVRGFGLDPGNSHTQPWTADEATRQRQRARQRRRRLVQKLRVLEHAGLEAFAIRAVGRGVFRIQGASRCSWAGRQPFVGDLPSDNRTSPPTVTTRADG